MNISELYNKGKTVFSFEVFPPKKESAVEGIISAVSEITALKPDYMSVTYGAGGTLADNKTVMIASKIRNDFGIESMAHLTCINSTAAEVDAVLEQLKNNGINNILALRGDINPNIEPKKEFMHASDLVSYIKSKGDFDIAGACYPEGHVEAGNMIEDIKYLKHKVDCGTDHLISQLFFDNVHYYNFIEKARIAGINVPVSAGIMPCTSRSQIERMVSTCGASLPQKFVKMIQKYENKPEALVDAGIAYAVDQIVDLMSNGVEGIHVYAMNKPYVARKIKESIETLL